MYTCNEYSRAVVKIRVPHRYELISVKQASFNQVAFIVSCPSLYNSAKLQPKAQQAASTFFF